MGMKAFLLVVTLPLVLSAVAAATTFTAEVSDSDGHPVQNAVVTLVPAAKGVIPAPATLLSSEKSIDQRSETFIPLVTIVPKGGRIVFANNDQTTHQVYSFSPVKQFEITLARGEKSPPMSFDNPGVAALGCNIHDHMIAYAFVADSPWTTLTGADGRAVIGDVPPGNYEAHLWHPKFPPGRTAPSLRISVSGDSIRAALTIQLLSVPTTSRTHAGSY
jgi:plastocyanin